MSADVSDGDLARLARGGDPVAFRLLVERHQAMVRARAPCWASSARRRDDLGAGIVTAGVPGAGPAAGCGPVRRLAGRHRVQRLPPAAPPCPGHAAARLARVAAPDVGRRPALGRGLDRADALRAAVAGLLAGQRRAVTLHYTPTCAPARSRRRPARPGPACTRPGSSWRLPHRAPPRSRSRLRDDTHDHRPRRAHRAPHPGRSRTDRFPTHVMVLADDGGRRDLPIWLLGRDSHRFADDARPGPSSDELTERLLRVAGARVTAVDVDELGSEVTAARIELAIRPAGARHRAAARRPGRCHHGGRADPCRRRGHGGDGGAGRGQPGRPDARADRA